MRHRTLIVVAALLSLPFVTGRVRALDPDQNSSAHQDPKIVRATLQGADEVPPISTTAQGSVRLVLHEDSIEYQVSFDGLSSMTTQSHVHFAPTKVNGGVMFFFCTNLVPPPAPVPVPQACPASGTVTGTITAADVVGPDGQGIAPGEFAAVLRAIETGEGYANVHTTSFQAGEIRGQLH